MKILILVASILSAVLSAPQYGHQASITCRTEYTTVWDTEYVETKENICETEYVEKCETLYQQQCRPTTRQVCNTNNEQQCTTAYKKECHDEYKTEYENYVETECTTTYKEDCQYHWEGTGNDKRWVPDRSTCQNNPYDTCQDVKKQKAKQVAYPVCKDVPYQKCVNVPVTKCEQVPDKVCTNEPYTKCDQVPQEKCRVEHKKTPKRVSKSVPKKVCDSNFEGSVRSGETGGVELVTQKSPKKKASKDVITFKL
jgi:hypothetical protein